MSAADLLEGEERTAPNVSMLIRALAAAEDEKARCSDVVATAQKALMVAGGNVGVIRQQLSNILRPGDSVAVKIGANACITVTMPAAGSATWPTCVRSRIVA